MQKCLFVPNPKNASTLTYVGKSLQTGSRNAPFCSCAASKTEHLRYIPRGMTGFTGFNERLRIARKARHRTRVWLADKVGVHHTTVARWEKTGGEIPSLACALAVCDALDVSMRWLTLGNPIYMDKPELAWRDEATLLRLYRQLNEDGKKALLEMVRDSTAALKKASAQEP